MASMPAIQPASADVDPAGIPPLPPQRSASPLGREGLLSNVDWSALAGLTTMAGRFAAGVAVARLLGPTRSGTLLYLLWIGEFDVIVATLAVPYAVTRFIADLVGQGRRAEAEATQAWLYRRFVGLAGAGAVAAAAICWRAAGDEALLLSCAMGAHVFTLALSTYYLAYLSGLQDFRRSARLAVVSSVALVAGVVAGGRALGVFGAVLGYLMGSVPGAALSTRCLALGAGAPAVPHDLRSRIMKYAMYTWVSAIVSAFVNTRSEVFFIERYAGSFWVAMFTIGTSLSMLATQGPLLLTGALLPYFAQLAGSGRHDALRARYVVAIRVLAFMLAPLCFGLASLMPVVLPLVYGPEYSAAIGPAIVLAAASVVAFGTVGTAALQAFERAGCNALVGTLGAISAVLAGFFLVPRMGIWGAVWSRAAIQVAMLCLGATYLATRHGCRFPLRDVGKILVAAGLCAASSAGLVALIRGPVAVAVAVPVAAGVYFLLIRAMHLLRPEDAALLHDLTGRLPRSMSQRAAHMVIYASGGLRPVSGERLVNAPL
jgi:O-antigen/teichoic acid export membrane protein